MTSTCRSTLLKSLLVVSLASRSIFGFVLPLLAGRHNAAVATQIQLHATTSVDTSFMWNAGLNFGKGPFKFYSGFDQWMSAFPDEDRVAYPEVFRLPKGTFEVQLARPLGIVFEEIDQGKGLYVQSLVEGGNAEQEGSVKVNDVLVGITAVKIVGAKFERRLIPCRFFDFDTMVGAVSSNEPKWGCNNVILMFERPGECDSQEVQNFMAFFEPPFDNPWKQQQ